MLPLILLFAFIIGAAIGSFAGVLIYRIPRKESIVWPSSHCESCKAPIKPYDNIPIISYLILGGKCRQCKSRIPIKYPIIEFLMGVVFVIIIYCLLIIVY